MDALWEQALLNLSWNNYVRLFFSFGAKRLFNLYVATFKNWMRTGIEENMRLLLTWKLENLVIPSKFLFYLPISGKIEELIVLP